MSYSCLFNNHPENYMVFWHENGIVLNLWSVWNTLASKRISYRSWICGKSVKNVEKVHKILAKSAFERCARRIWELFCSTDLFSPFLLNFTAFRPFPMSFYSFSLLPGLIWCVSNFSASPTPKPTISRPTSSLKLLSKPICAINKGHFPQKDIFLHKKSKNLSKGKKCEIKNWFSMCK